MLIRYYDHSFFTLETLSGTLIAFDPYDKSVGYTLPQLAPDVVLMSHAHHDHANSALFPKAKVYITDPGTYKEGAVIITGIAAFHDDKGGQLRGPNTLFKVEAEGLSILHLGDLGHLLSLEQLNAIGHVDILMVPVGGYYTIDAQTAKAVTAQVKPRVVIPMHYKTRTINSWPISTLESFTSLFEVVPDPMPIVRVVWEDIMCLPKVIVMKRM